jgi:hypothetical protein
MMQPLFASKGLPLPTSVACNLHTQLGPRPCPEKGHKRPLSKKIYRDWVDILNDRFFTFYVFKKTGLTRVVGKSAGYP